MSDNLLFPDLYREPLAPAPTGEQRASARRTDPESSHIAAAQHESKGKAKANRVLVESYVYRWPGRTSKELAAIAGVELDRWEIARRLPEVEAEGTIERRQEGTKELTWHPRD